MVLIRRRRLSGYWNVQSETNTSKFHSKKWSRVVDNKTFSLVILLLCFTNCWRETKAVSSGDGTLTVPQTKTLSQLYKVCKNQTNQTNFQDYGFLIVDIIQEMHFDFCNGFHPAFFLPRRKINKNGTQILQINVIETKYNISSPLNISVDSIYNCADIKALQLHEDYYEKVYMDYAQLLDRTDDCTLQTIIKCPLCKRTYREWACSLFASQYMTGGLNQPVCPYLFSKVCHDCPSVQPAVSYGGYSIFQCVGDGGHEVQCFNHQNYSCASFSCLPTYNETSVSIP